MGESTGIAWTDHTFSPWHGCVKVSPGCANCYAEKLSKRWGREIWGPDSERRFLSESYWKQPLKWDKQAEREGVRRRVFCASMADVFESRPDLREPRIRLFHLIEDTPNLDWQLLTKRPGNIMNLVPGRWFEEFPENVWIGTSVENQEYVVRRIPALLRVPARVRFLSCEPLLGPLDLLQWLPGIHWMIVGGESGPGARPFNLEWARSLRSQAHGAGVAFFMKQMGARPVGANGERFPFRHRKGEDPSEWPPLLRVQEFPVPRGVTPGGTA